MNKNATRVSVLGLMSVLVLSVVCLSSNRTTRGASTIIVPDDYSTIQEAINSAADGDTVFVRAGTYFEHVVVNKTIALMGEDNGTTVIDGNGTGQVVSVVRDSVNVTGFAIQRGGSIALPELDCGICLNTTTDCSIFGNRIVENGCFGIHLLNYGRNLVSGNSFSGNTLFAVELTNSSDNIISCNSIVDNPGTGVGMHASSRSNMILGNTVRNCTYSISLNNATNNTIESNHLEDNGEIGIWMQSLASNNTVYENSVTSCTCGIKVEDQANNNTLADNLVTSCQFGTYVQNAKYTEVLDNTIAHNYGPDEWDAGIRLESASYTVIHDNEITDNWRGILLYASSPYVSIYGNNVTSNEYGIRVAMGGSSYVNVSGNYVADNRGYGIDVTGFGGGGESNYATIARNLIVNNTFEAVGLGIGSSYNTVVQNDMIGNGHAGVTLERYSNYNTVVQNNIIGNAYGICFDIYTVNSTQNVIFNNNMINNTQQVRIVSGSINAWNGSYALGGNYWSDYTGSDCRNGPSQNLVGCDGIGDTPNVFDSSNRDNYPLMKPIPWDSDDIGVTCFGKVGSQGASSMKTVIAEDTTVHFSVFIMNYGNVTETFNVTVYFNETLLDTQTSIVIASKGFAILNFTWDTITYEMGNCVISAQVTAVPGETDTDDNILICTVAIGLIGDVDDNGIVNMLDVYNIALHYGALVGQAHYVSNYDIDDNGIINMLDLYNTAVHYGQTASASMCVNVSVLTRRSD